MGSPARSAAWVTEVAKTLGTGGSPGNFSSRWLAHDRACDVALAGLGVAERGREANLAPARSRGRPSVSWIVIEAFSGQQHALIEV